MKFGAFRWLNVLQYKLSASVMNEGVKVIVKTPHHTFSFLVAKLQIVSLI